MRGTAATLALSTTLLLALGASTARAQGAGAGPAAPAPQPPSAGDTWRPSPATAADPPLLPAPTPSAPTSTSGTDVAPPSNQPPVAPIVVDSKSDSATLAKVRELEARVA